MQGNQGKILALNPYGGGFYQLNNNDKVSVSVWNSYTDHNMIIMIIKNLWCTFLKHGTLTQNIKPRAMLVLVDLEQFSQSLTLYLLYRSMSYIIDVYCAGQVEYIDTILKRIKLSLIV